MQKITAELLGSGRILLDGKQVNLPFKQAEALVYYLLVEKETFRPSSPTSSGATVRTSTRCSPTCATPSM